MGFYVCVGSDLMGFHRVLWVVDGDLMGFNGIVTVIHNLMIFHGTYGTYFTDFQSILFMLLQSILRGTGKTCKMHSFWLCLTHY